jgi:hypothetical protein
MPMPSQVRNRGQTPFSSAVAGACLGTLLVVVHAPLLEAQSPPTWTLTRDLRIDAGERDLSPISWLAVAPNGTILVNQSQDGQVRFFDARGADLGTFGRKGQGPGEFETATRSGWIGDTLWVGDFSTRRFTLVSPDRKLLRTTPWLVAAAMSGELPGITMQDVTSVTQYALHADGSQVVALLMREESGSTTANRTTPVARADRSGRLARLIGIRPSVDCFSRVSMGRGGFMVAAVPFCALLLEDFSPDGGRWAIAVVDGERASYRVSVVRTTGDTVFNRLYAYRPVPLPKATFDSVIARRTARGQPEAIAMWRGMTAPASYPPLSRIVLGRDQTTWLEVYSTEGDRQWLVLDARGEPVGRVAVPRGVRIQAASRESIWATDTDEDGLQHIMRFAIAARP